MARREFVQSVATRGRAMSSSARCVVTCALVVGCSPDPIDDLDPTLCGDSLEPCTDVRIVAHEDDDLLFMNPDIGASIGASNRVVTIFVTAGTVSDPERLSERETGMLNAYAFMVSPEYAVTRRDDDALMLAHWRLHGGQPISIEIGGSTRQAIQYDFIPSNGLLSLVFLRVVEQSDVDLAALVRGDVSEIATVACAVDCVHGSSLAAQTYDKQQLVGTLEALIERFDDPSQRLAVSTLDATGLFHRDEGYGLGWVDHADHLATAELAVAAFVRHQRRSDVRSQTLYQYRGYNIGREPENLGAVELTKRQAFYRYFVVGEPEEVDETGMVIPYTNGDPADPHFLLDTYEAWTARRYLIESMSPTIGVLAVNEHCLHANRPSPMLGRCADAPRWELSPSHRVRLAAEPDSCLTIESDGLVGLAPCASLDNAQQQTFIFTTSGQIRVRDAGCLHAELDLVQATVCAKRVAASGDPIGRPIPAQGWSWR